MTKDLAMVSEPSVARGARDDGEEGRKAARSAPHSGCLAARRGFV